MKYIILTFFVSFCHLALCQKNAPKIDSIPKMKFSINDMGDYPVVHKTSINSFSNNSNNSQWVFAPNMNQVNLATGLQLFFIDNQLEMDSQTVMDLLESNSGIEKAMYFINDKGEFYNPSGIDEEFQFAIKQEIRRSNIKVGSVLIIKTNSKE